VHPGIFAAKEPARPAVIMGAAGTVVTYAELEARSNQVAWLVVQVGELGAAAEAGGAAAEAGGAAAEAGGAELAERLGAYCREHLAGFKCPRSYEFTTTELRTPVGKIRRGPLREQFGADPGPYRPHR